MGNCRISPLSLAYGNCAAGLQSWTSPRSQCDHIAAIDNVTRKLMQEGKRPVAVGLMFSLGHSTIVLLGSAAIAATALALHHRIDSVRNIGGVIGTLVSVLFLFGIAIVNLVVLRSIYDTFARAGAGSLMGRRTLTCCSAIEACLLASFVRCSG